MKTAVTVLAFVSVPAVMAWDWATMKGEPMSPRSLLVILTVTGCAHAPDDTGVLVMAHGGSEEWDRAVREAVAPLEAERPVEIAFGMADAASLQEAVDRLEARGVRRIGVVRLFVSGESWTDRTEQILGLREGAPDRPPGPSAASHGHRMEFWRIRCRSKFALSREGLAESRAMGAILAERASILSVQPSQEDVLILAHGPADDAENSRWIERIDALADAVRADRPYRRVEVQTLREDWPDKRAAAEERIRAFVRRAEGRAIVIPFRVHGFGPYAEVLAGLDYAADGRGLLPHAAVTRWIQQQAERLSDGPFRGAETDSQILLDGARGGR